MIYNCYIQIKNKRSYLKEAAFFVITDQKEVSNILFNTLLPLRN